MPDPVKTSADSPNPPARPTSHFTNSPMPLETGKPAGKEALRGPREVRLAIRELIHDMQRLAVTDKHSYQEDPRVIDMLTHAEFWLEKREVTEEMWAKKDAENQPKQVTPKVDKPVNRPADPSPTPASSTQPATQPTRNPSTTPASTATVPKPAVTPVVPATGESKPHTVSTPQTAAPINPNTTLDPNRPKNPHDSQQP